MRLVIDTNVLISALLAPKSLPSHLVSLWRNGFFDLLTADEQLEEIRRVTRYPKLRDRLPHALAGRLINELRSMSIMAMGLPDVTICRDPFDNYLLALAQVGAADFLVTGDKISLLHLKVYQGCRIVTAREFLTMTKQASHH